MGRVGEDPGNEVVLAHAPLKRHRNGWVERGHFQNSLENLILFSDPAHERSRMIHYLQTCDRTRGFRGRQ